MSEQKLAESYIRELDPYWDRVKVSNTDRGKIKRSVSINKILIATLPIILPFASSFVYVVTQQVVALFINLVNVILPFYNSTVQTEVGFYNQRIELESDMVKIRESIRRLAELNELSLNAGEIRQNLDRLISKLKEVYKV